MKRISIVAAICGLAGSLSAQQAIVMPIPTVTARTNAVAKRILRSDDGTTKTAQDSRAMSVTVKVGFLTKPPLPYEVQCFFIAKDSGNQARSIFDALSETSQATTAEFEFDSQPIAGGTKRWESVPISVSSSGMNSSGFSESRTTIGRTIKTSKSAGNKIEGWIIRLVAQGKVLRVESNQPMLAKIAGGMSEELDKAAAKIEAKPK